MEKKKLVFSHFGSVLNICIFGPQRVNFFLLTQILSTLKQEYSCSIPTYYNTEIEKGTILEDISTSK